MSDPNPSKPCSVERVMEMVEQYASAACDVNDDGYKPRAYERKINADLEKAESALRTQIAAMVEVESACRECGKEGWFDVTPIVKALAALSALTASQSQPPPTREKE